MFLIPVAIIAVSAALIVAAPPKPVVIDPVPNSENWSETVATATLPAVGRVTVGKSGSGTAFFYTDTRMLTAAHVISQDVNVLAEVNLGKKPVVKIDMYQGQQIDAKVIALDSKLDVAVLEATLPANVKPLGLSTAEPKPGQPVLSAGASFASQIVVGSGVVSGVLLSSTFATDPVQTVLISSDTTVNPGMSGGPLLNTSGQVLGVVVSRPDTVAGRPATGTSLIVPSSLLTRFITSAKPGSGTGHYVAGIVGRYDITRNGIVVTEIGAGSAAEKEGIKTGDVITEINGQPVISAASLGLTIAEGNPVKFTIDSNGTTRTVTVTPLPRK